MIYQKGKQFALLEALKIGYLDREKLNDHMKRMLNNYDTQGVPITCLVIFAYTQQGQNFFTKVERYLDEYLGADSFPYHIVNGLEKTEIDTSNICHHVMTYQREEMLQKMHVFTVLM